MSDVLAIVTNYRRPANIAPIIDALTAQVPQPPRIIVVDNSPGIPGESGTHAFLERNPAMRRCADIWRFTINHGPPCRFAPALLHHDARYVLFLDDDMIPGPRAVEHLVATANSLGNEFATLGEIGRSFGATTAGAEYVRHNMRRLGVPRRVDMCCRAHFTHLDAVWLAVALKWDLIEKFGDAARRLVERHDDILLCLAIQRGTGHPTYLTPAGPSETLLRGRDLPDAHAASARPRHVAERTQLIRFCEQVGWKPLV